MRVGIIGGGLQGALIALGLAQRGIRVDILERLATCVAGASANNEGKIHLGYVYGNDPSLATARTMVEGATSFASIVAELVDSQAFDAVGQSTPFDYLVHRDSLLERDQVGGHLRAVDALIADALAAGGNYLGLKRLPSIAQRAVDERYDSALIAGVFATVERAIDPRRLADVVRARLAAEPNITIIAGADVHTLQAGTRIAVQFRQHGTEQVAHYEQVINAAPESRLALDADLGLQPRRPWLFRFKNFVRISAVQAAVLPSTTIVLGPFGDVVNYGDGQLYLSWYPSGMTAKSTALRFDPAQAQPKGQAAEDLKVQTLASLQTLVPALAVLPPNALATGIVSGGTIFAWGKTDVDDPSSGLHERHQIGPLSVGNYHSVDSGKLTTIPLFARRLVDRIVPARTFTGYSPAA